MPKELIILHSPGALPGIPGESHGPGAYLVDWEARTIEPLLVDVTALPPTSLETPVQATESHPEESQEE